MSAVPTRASELDGSLGAGVTDGYKQPGVGAENPGPRLLLYMLLTTESFCQPGVHFLTKLTSMH